MTMISAKDHILYKISPLHSKITLRENKKQPCMTKVLQANDVDVDTGYVLGRSEDEDYQGLWAAPLKFGQICSYILIRLFSVWICQHHTFFLTIWQPIHAQLIECLLICKTSRSYHKVEKQRLLLKIPKWVECMVTMLHMDS